MRRFARQTAGVFITLALASSILLAAEFSGVDSPSRLLDRARGAESRALRLDPQATLRIVARRMGVELDPGMPAPAIRFESVTPLERFQDATEQQWGFRPDRFVNVFVSEKNEIYLIDDPAYYATTGRTIDESLAHELVHYVQERYGRTNHDDWAEHEAVAIQKWFRGEYLDSLAGRLASAPD